VDRSSFSDGTPGRLVSTPDGHPAFAPGAAPRQLDPSSTAVRLLDQAATNLGILNGIGRRLPNPHLLIAPYLLREAVLSSRIEGTQTTMSDLYASELDQMELVRAPDVREVQNYVTAYQLGLASELPLSLRLIRELHRELMTGVRGQERHPGQFRSYQNYVGGTSAADATYVGPPPGEMERCLDDFERFIHEDSLLPLVQAAVLHYQFEAIHPFGDGNGRVGRLLIALFLRDRGLLPQPLLYLSAYFERTRDEYYDRLMAVSTDGDWDGWLSYFLAGVSVQAQEAADLADRLLAMQERYRAELMDSHVTANVLALVDQLFINPLVTTRRVQNLLGVSAPTARAAIKTLEQEGILRETSGRNWGRVYQADEVDRLLRGGP
jgi:Fic family protein